MNQFDRYILKRYLLTLGAVLIIFATLMVVYFVVDELRLFLKYEAGWGIIIRYIALSIPQLIISFFPLVILLSVVFTLHQMSKWGEITGIMAAGGSIRQISTGFIFVGLLLAFLQFLSNEYAAAWCVDQARKIKTYEIKQSDSQSEIGPTGQFVRGAENRFYHCLYFDRDQKTLIKVRLFQLSPNNQYIQTYLKAESAKYEGDYWLFNNGQRNLLRGTEIISSEKFVTLRVNLPETADDFADLSLDPRSMSYRRLADHMQMLESSGEDPAKYSTELYLKLAFPLSCVIFTLFGIVISFRMKATNLTFELGISIAFSLLFFAVTAALIDFGAKLILPPWLAAWGSILVFGGIRMVSFMKMRTDYS